MNSTREISSCLVGRSEVIKNGLWYYSCERVCSGIERVWSGILLPVFDLEVVEEGLEVVLCCEACIEQEAFYAGPFAQSSIVEHLQVVGDDEGDDTCR